MLWHYFMSQTFVFEKKKWKKETNSIKNTVSVCVCVCVCKFHFKATAKNCQLLINDRFFLPLLFLFLYLDYLLFSFLFLCYCCCYRCVKLFKTCNGNQMKTMTTSCSTKPSLFAHFLHKITCKHTYIDFVKVILLLLDFHFFSVSFL